MGRRKFIMDVAFPKQSESCMAPLVGACSYNSMIAAQAGRNFPRELVRTLNTSGDGKSKGCKGGRCQVLRFNRLSYRSKIFRQSRRSQGCRIPNASGTCRNSGGASRAIDLCCNLTTPPIICHVRLARAHDVPHFLCENGIRLERVLRHGCRWTLYSIATLSCLAKWTVLNYTTL